MIKEDFQKQKLLNKKFFFMILFGVQFLKTNFVDYAWFTNSLP